MRPSGTPIIYSFHSFWVCTRTQLDALCATLRRHTLPSLEMISGIIALGMRAGGGSCGAVRFTSASACIGKSAVDETPESFASFAIHMVGSHSQQHRSFANMMTDAMEIQFQKPSMKYKAGQWLFLNVPSVSTQQWHPFTITSCPYDDYISVHVRQVGDFTRALGDAVGAGPSQAKLFDNADNNVMYEVALENGQQMPALRIDGPYGAPAEDVFENEIAVLIGTGIGVTPWASILKNIWHLRNGPNPPTRLRRVEFIWVCRDTTSFEWFQSLLSSLEEQSFEAAGRPGSGSEFLRIHTYLTQKLDADTAQNIVLNSVGASVDPLTELKSRTNFGRPDFERLFTGMREGILNRTYLTGLDGTDRTNVGVYFCGPNAAASAIKTACKRATCPEVNFSFWKEHF
jgi:NADPH oxidase